MSFISLEYAILCSIVIPVHFLLPHRLRWVLLFVSSSIFYMAWRAEYIILILITTAFDYYLALAISRSVGQFQRKIFLSFSLALNLGILFVFKYFNFLSTSISPLLCMMGVYCVTGTLNILLPVGISFYTFQEMGYVINVYQGKVTPEQRFGILATFIMFFPQLVAGPIERAENLLPQFHRRMIFDVEKAVEGFRLILWGVFKKVVIADRLAVYVNEVYGHPRDFNGLILTLATVFFAFQIYCDFSGYTSIAIGSARVMGFDLIENFRQPYFSTSVREFWRRWHVSLSTWFRDFVYFPLGGNRCTPRRQVVNLMTVFLLSGLWHGANWTFVLWGFIHGLYVVIESMPKPAWNRDSILFGVKLHPLVFSLVRMGTTFALVNLAWVFFRANSVTDAFYIVGQIFTVPTTLSGIIYPFGVRSEFIIAIVVIGLLLVVDMIDARWGVHIALNKCPEYLRWFFYYAVTAGIFLFGTWGKQEFIYFQF